VTVDFLMPRSYVAQLEFGTPTPDYQKGTVQMLRYVYLYPTGEKPEKKEEDNGLEDFTTSFYLIAVGLAGVGVFLKRRH